MRRYIHTLLATAILLGLLVAGCSDRGTNVPERTDTTGWTYVTRENPTFVPNSTNPSPKLMFQRGNPDGLLRMAVYVPKKTMLEGIATPLLILLAPQEGDHFYYFERGLHKICNEMIADGEIIPMIVACVANDDKFGGYFYGNSFPAGFYDDVLGAELIDVLQFRYPMLVNSRNKRAIGGFGQGAYGAMRAALQHPGMFGSVSGVDGPLDFDGATGRNGLMELFNDANFEQPNGWFTGQIDTAKAKVITRMFIGGCFAFSPHDTLLDYTGTRHAPGNLDILQRYSFSSSATLINTVMPGRLLGGPIRSSESVRFDIHLPFDGTSRTDAETWHRWMDNNLDTLFVKAGGNPLQNTAVWLGTSPQANRLTFHDQTLSFAAFLRSQQIEPTMFEFSGYTGNPATEDQYTYYLLRELLKFHSEQFLQN